MRIPFHTGTDPRPRSSAFFACLVVLVAFSLVLLPGPYGAVRAAEIISVESEGTMQTREVDRFLQPLFEGYPQPEAFTAVEVFVIRIRSRYPDGTPTEVRVQVFLPDLSADEVRGVYLFAPGSTGMIGPCRASREHEAGIRWGLYRAHVLAFAGQGLIGILPDYIGFEDALQVQPYFHAESEARVIFDALHAVDKWIRPRFSRGIGPYTRIAGGFSQGGHAVFAAADRNRSFGGNLPLHGVVGYGATTRIEPLFLSYPSLAPMIAQAFTTIYGVEHFDPTLVLQRRWAESLEYDTTRQCVGGIQRYYPSDPADLFTAPFLDSLRTGTLPGRYPEIAAIFEENATGLTRHRVPSLILQGAEDIVVSRILTGERHDTRQRGFPVVLDWLESLPDPLSQLREMW